MATNPAPTNTARLPAPAAGSARAMLDIAVVREQFESLLKARAPQFIASLANALYTNKRLGQCQPESVINAALIAAALDLPIEPSLGFAYIIPYNGIAQFQMGYRGYIQLAIRSGQYRTINANVVYEGEVQFNRFTGEIRYSERTSDKAVGFLAHLKLNNGFEKMLYSTTEEVTAHAKRYSKSYSKPDSAWQTNFNEMGMKTVLKSLISHWGVMSVDMRRAYQIESENAAHEMNMDALPGDVFDHQAGAAALWGDPSASPQQAQDSAPAPDPARAPAQNPAPNGNGNGKKKPADIKCPAKDWVARCVEIASVFEYYRLPNGQPDMAKIQWTLPTIDYPTITAVNLEVAFEALGEYAKANHPNKPVASGDVPF